MKSQLTGHEGHILVRDYFGLRVADVLHQLVLGLDTEQVNAVVERLHNHARVVELAL